MKVTYATRQEGVFYGITAFAFMFMAGSFMCFTIILAIIGVPLIILSLWSLVTCPWAYKKLRAGACPVCDARCIFAPKIRARKCPVCRTRLIIKNEELCKVEA